MNEPAHKTARDLIRLWNYDGASRIVDSELERCADQGTSAEVWSLRCLRAEIISLRGDSDEALVYLAAKENENPPESGDIPSFIRLKRTCGHCQGMLGKYAISDKLLGEAEHLAKNAGLLELLCEVWHRQAWHLYVRANWESSDPLFRESSEHLFREILRVSEQAGGWYFRAIGLWGIGKNTMMRGHANRDATLLKEALRWFEESDDLFASAGRQMFAWGDMAVCYLDLGDDQRSLELLEASLPVYAEAGWVHRYQVTIANIGNVYRERGDYLQAIDYYRTAVEYA